MTKKMKEDQLLNLHVGAESQTFAHKAQRHRKHAEKHPVHVDLFKQANKAKTAPLSLTYVVSAKLTHSFFLY